MKEIKRLLFCCENFGCCDICKNFDNKIEVGRTYIDGSKEVY